MSEPISIQKERSNKPTRFDNDPNNAQGALQYVLQVMGQITQKLFDMQSEASAQQNKASYELMIKGYNQKLVAIDHEAAERNFPRVFKLRGVLWGVLYRVGL